MSRRRIFVRALALALAVGVTLVATGGRATIEEQRARLPPPAECGDDPVEGIWKSHKYNPMFGDWSVFTLHIRRVEGSEGELTGLIRNHGWSGGPHDEEPPDCGRGGWQWIVSMDARGTIDAQGHIRFGGVGQWRLDQAICRRGPWGYNLDNFSGTIDSTIQEFQTLNNDGGRDRNVPYVFRRIRCFPPESTPAPSVESAPPPFYPDRAGCNCSLF